MHTFSTCDGTGGAVAALWVGTLLLGTSVGCAAVSRTLGARLALLSGAWGLQAWWWWGEVGGPVS